MPSIPSPLLHICNTPPTKINIISEISKKSLHSLCTAFLKKFFFELQTCVVRFFYFFNSTFWIWKAVGRFFFYFLVSATKNRGEVRVGCDKINFIFYPVVPGFTSPVKKTLFFTSGFVDANLTG